MPEPDVAAPGTAPADQPPAPTEPATQTETALTREDLTALIQTLRTDVLAETKRDTDAAYKAARRSESKGDAANAKLAKIESQLAELVVRGMDEPTARAWRAERALEVAQETTATLGRQQEYEQQAAAFQQRSGAYLASEGIKPDDPRLTTAFAKLAADAKSYDDWDKALLGAVSTVHKDNATRLTAETTKLATDSKSAVDKAREEERAKLRNEQRNGDGPIDKGQPSSTVPTKKTWDMTDEEFKAYDAQRDAERRRRMRQLG